LRPPAECSGLAAPAGVKSAMPNRAGARPISGHAPSAPASRPPLQWLALAAVLVLLALPAVLTSYAVTVFILIFFYAFLGQAWNVVGGYAGQLSVGHAAFVGVGGYTAAMLSSELHLTPWLGMLVVDTFKYKMLAMIVSSFLTGVGGTFYAFYLFSLQPNSMFGIPLSVEIIIRPIVGGAGTLLGPILGSFILTPLGELSRLSLGH